jgi:hypothetical protein
VKRRGRQHQWIFSLAAVAMACSTGSARLSQHCSGPARTLTAINVERELLIRDLSVVQDPIRTLEPCGAIPAQLPAWSFGGVMTRIAAQAGAADASDFTLKWLETWEHDQVVNGRVVPGQPFIRDRLLDRWLVASGGEKLDLRRAPFRLLAIVNRIDLRRTRDGKPLDAGEGRFVFGGVDDRCRPMAMTVSFEFEQPATEAADVVQWAMRWHALGRQEFGLGFNEALEALTNSLGKLVQLRTNEVAISLSEWEMRAFTASAGRLSLIPVEQTPDANLRGTSELVEFINDHEIEIRDGRHLAPESMLGAVATVNFTWFAPGIRDPGEARHRFALATCNGCHLAETGTRFLHVFPRYEDQVADLSDFLTGQNMPTRDGLFQPRVFHELDTRAEGLQKLLEQGPVSYLAARVPSSDRTVAK